MVNMSSSSAATKSNSKTVSNNNTTSSNINRQHQSSLSKNASSFDISQLPSLKKDGMTVEQEALQRRKTCRFIEEAGRIIKLPRVAIASAMVMFHRFYAKHSFSDHDRFEVAIACIVLAAKTEESPKKLSTVIVECHKLKVQGMKAGRINNSNIATGSTTSSSAASSNNNNEILDVKGEEYMKLKERVLLLERVILHTIGFELSIDHPYKFMVDQIRTIVVKQLVEFDESVIQSEGINCNSSEMMKKMNNRLVQMSMNFANDSMHTSLCLQFDPKDIATACVYLGCNFAKLRPKSMATSSSSSTTVKSDSSDAWLEILGYPDVDALVSISLQILELITERKGSDKVLVDKIRQFLEELERNSSSSSPPDMEVIELEKDSDENMKNKSSSISTTTTTTKSDDRINSPKRQRTG